jgi:hypothetical protein
MAVLVLVFTRTTLRRGPVLATLWHEKQRLLPPRVDPPAGVSIWPTVPDTVGGLTPCRRSGPLSGTGDPGFWSIPTIPYHWYSHAGEKTSGK